MSIIFNIVTLLLGCIIGAFIAEALYAKFFAKDGVLLIDKSDPEKDKYNLEIYRPLEGLEKRKYIVLRIKNADILDSNMKA